MDQEKLQAAISARNAGDGVGVCKRVRHCVMVGWLSALVRFCSRELVGFAGAGDVLCKKCSGLVMLGDLPQD
jgi:hypothetical protein